MSITVITLYDPLIPVGDLVGTRMFLPGRTSRMTIVRTRKTLGERKVRKYGTPKELVNPKYHLDTHCYVNDVSPEYYDQFVEKSNAYPKRLGTKGGEGR